MTALARCHEWRDTGSLDADLTDDERAFWQERLSELVVIRDECWIFQGYVDRNGYAKWRGPRWDIGGWAHRNAWFIFYGPIPWHLEIDHLCFVQTCVNPAHMELVTPDENKRRMHARRADHRNAAPFEHGKRGWVKGCTCKECYEGRPFPYADLGSRVEVAPIDAPDLCDARDVLIDLRPVAWMESAACATSDVDLWTKGSVGCTQLARAQAICERCPVVDECLAYAIETQPAFGIWAGFRPEDFASAGMAVAS